MRRIVVVGASLAGLRAAEALRQEGFDGALTLVGAEDRRPYNRPPLSKQVLTGKQTVDEIYFPGADALGAEWRLGRKATRLDLDEGRLHLDDGANLPFDGLIVATGVTPRKPDVPGWTLPGAYLLRTLDDALALKAALLPGRRLAVVGAGFIGCEVAASAQTLGLDVTVIDPASTPMARVLATEIGALFVDIHAEKGVTFLLGRTVGSVVGEERVRGLILDDGSRIDADLVVFGVGSVPVTSWLDGSGLVLGNGIVCDEFSLAGGGGGRVAAAGDVACWRNVSYGGRMMRVEHWSNAVDQAINAARNLLCGPSVAYTPLMSLWSDQYQHKLQALGVPALGKRIEVAQGSIAERRFVAEYWDGDRLAGVIALDMPARMASYRRRLQDDIAVMAAAHRQGAVGAT